MFNVQCCKLHDRWSLKIFRGILLNGDPGVFVFFWGGLPEEGAQLFLEGCEIRRNYGMVVILLSLLCNYDNSTLKLPQEKCRYPDEIWLFIGSVKVGSVLGVSLALVAFKKSIKIDHESDARPLKKSYKCY